MLIFKGLERLSSLPKPTAVAIGNFDGLHLGHQAILRVLIGRAAAANLVSLVLTFSPHPEKVLGRQKIAMIQTLAQRLAGLRRSGVQAVLVAPFDREFSRLSGQEFFEHVIVSLLRAREVIVGEGFLFGLDRQGNVEEMRRFGARREIIVHSVPPVKFRGQKVSSSLIRSLLWRGEVEKANFLLGRSYEIEGKIVQGSARGKLLGFPTANIMTVNEITPQGVFITEARLDRKTFPSVTNIGSRPTFGAEPFQVETFIFNFDRTVYGKKIRLCFLQKIRNERKFSTPQALVRQVRKDIKAARGYFERQGYSLEG